MEQSDLDRWLDAQDLRRLERDRQDYDMEGWQDGRGRRLWTLRRPEGARRDA